jgi:hypothetical protein
LLRRILGFALLLLVAVTPASAPAQTAQQRIVAVGDLHGDYDTWIAIARAAGLIDTTNHWAGGKATLVQLGDIVDRGPSSLRIIRHLQQLQREAAIAGGQVIVLLGNHEAMNLLGDLRYTQPGEYAEFADARSPARRERVYMASRRQLEAEAKAAKPSIKPSEVRAEWIARTPLGWVEHRAAWAPSGDVGRWAIANPAIAKLGDTLFVHGGLSADYARLGIDEINRRVRAAMASADRTSNSVLEDPLGPLWYRGLVTRDPRVDGEAASRAAKPRPAQDAEIAAVLAATGTKRIVVGHTPSLKGVVITFGGRLVRADTGNTRSYGGQPAYVEILGDKLSAHAVARPGTAP